MNIEDRMTIEELRREVRRLWNEEAAFTQDYRDLPEVCSYSTMILLSAGGFPHYWQIGASLQRRAPYLAIPYKTECEIGAGRWAVIRSALLASESAPREMVAEDIGIATPPVAVWQEIE